MATEMMLGATTVLMERLVKPIDFLVTDGPARAQQELAVRIANCGGLQNTMHDKYSSTHADQASRSHHPPSNNTYHPSYHSGPELATRKMQSLENLHGWPVGEVDRFRCPVTTSAHRIEEWQGQPRRMAHAKQRIQTSHAAVHRCAAGGRGQL